MGNIVKHRRASANNPSYRADFLIVGSGLAGSTFARLAAENGLSSHIIERRVHIGGNCFTYQDAESNVEVHKYGPHIFHTSSEAVWSFVNRFTRFNSYVNRVKARTRGSIYSFPINLHTINQFFGKAFGPAEAEAFIESVRVKGLSISNFEEAVLSSVGTELYEAFFKDYSLKQWGVHPSSISLATARRIPIRMNYDDNYYNDVYQGIPVDGYTLMIKRMLDHTGITVRLGSDFSEYKDNWRTQYRALVYSGSIDEYFQFTHGVLPYRTVRFKEIRGREIQGNAVINYCDMSAPFTRIHEHKWFTPERKFERSIGFEEYSDATDSRTDPYYPVRNTASDALFGKYEVMARDEKDVLFIGRLAEFRYYDMHQVIGSSMAKFSKYILEVRKP